MHELSKEFRFEAAHTLRRKIAADASRRIHGHSYRAQVTLRGEPDPQTGMVVDLGAVDEALTTVRDALDHRFLDDVEGLGPATLENLASFVWRNLEGRLPRLYKITVFRDSTGESCAVYHPLTD
jgi:6-pyruvoyltetrahydropterin/6-carboxytetrahydropterin synthase